MHNDEAALTTYLADVARRPRLSRAEELRLARAARRGDTAARDRLVEANLRLVVWIARRYTGMGLDLADLVQEGNIGLLRAVDRYDPERGPFAGCAQFWVRQAICRALSTQSRLVRVPLRLAESAEFRAREQAPVALEHAVGDDGTLMQRLADEHAADPAVVVADDSEPVVQEACSALNDRRRRLVELRFGLDGNGERSLSQVAQELGVCAERVRKLEEDALRELRRRPELQLLRAA